MNMNMFPCVVFADLRERVCPSCVHVPLYRYENVTRYEFFTVAPPETYLPLNGSNETGRLVGGAACRARGFLTCFRALIILHVGRRPAVAPREPSAE